MAESENSENQDAVPSPHDRFFREYFSDPEMAAGFLKSALRPTLVEQLDWESLEIRSGSFVDQNLRELQSDLLFQIPLTNTCEKIFVYVLWEHQKRPENFMPLRMLGYAVSIWQRWQRDERVDEKTLPPIVPIVLYQGKTAWKYPQNFHGLFDWEKFSKADFADRLPEFTFDLFESRNSADDPADSLARAGIELMRAVVIGDPLEWLERRGVELERLLQEADKTDRFLLFVSYLLQADRPLQKKRFRETLKKLSNQTQSETMTLYEQIKEEGIEIGEARGLEKGKEKGREAAAYDFARTLAADGFDLDAIARLTELPIEKIRELL